MNSSALGLARTAAANGRSNEELRLQHVVHYSDRMDNAVLRASTHLRTKLVAAHPDVDWLGQCDPVAPRSAWPGPPPYSHTSEHLLCTSEHFRRSSVHLRRTRAKPSRATQGFGSCDDRCTCAATFRNRFPMMARAARASVRRSPRTLDLTRRGVGARPVLAGGEQRSANARPGAHSLCLRCISARRPECGTSATLTLAALGTWPSRIHGCGVAVACGKRGVLGLIGRGSGRGGDLSQRPSPWAATGRLERALARPSRQLPPVAATCTGRIGRPRPAESADRVRSGRHAVGRVGRPRAVQPACARSNRPSPCGRIGLQAAQSASGRCCRAVDAGCVPKAERARRGCVATTGADPVV